MTQLKAYHRPTSINEALQLLSRPNVNAAIVAGGTSLNARIDEAVDEVVDLQAVGLDQISHNEGRLTLGAMVRLQTIAEDERTPFLLREMARREGPNTFRNMGTIGGVVVNADWESELLAALLVFEAEVEIRLAPPEQGESKTIALSDFLANVPAALKGGLVTAVSLTTGGKTANERVARTPVDKPIVAAVGRVDNRGRLRPALCGVAKMPVLANLDQLEATLIPLSDFRGSGEYRRAMATTLSKRVVAKLESVSET
jgi:CO/xanthine dehydrogenase FAD-binding subunit